MGMLGLVLVQPGQFMRWLGANTSHTHRPLLISVHTQTDRAEHQHPMKISVHRGITVSWHDNLLLKCTTALFSPTIEHCRQLIHYHWVPFLFPSPSPCVTPTDSPSHSPPPPLSLAGVSWCENLIMFCYWTCKLNWTESYSLGVSQCVCIVFLCECGCTCIHASLCVPRCAHSDQWWINQEGLHQCDSAQVVKYSPFPSTG